MRTLIQNSDRAILSINVHPNSAWDTATQTLYDVPDTERVKINKNKNASFFLDTDNVTVLVVQVEVAPEKPVPASTFTYDQMFARLDAVIANPIDSNAIADLARILQQIVYPMRFSWDVPLTTVPLDSPVPEY